MKTTADLSDDHPDAQVAEPLFQDYGGLHCFSGPVVTVKVFEDNTMVKTILEEPGDGRVLVIDGGGSMRCALVGGTLAQLGTTNSWQGILVNGCIRDCLEIRQLAIGVRALGVNPRRSQKGLHSGRRNHTVRFAGVEFKSGQWLYADFDGILVADSPVH